MGNENRWHLMSAEQAVSALSTDVFAGLSSSDAKSRLSHGGENGIWKVKRASVFGYTLEVLSDLATALLVAAAIIAAVFGYGAEAGAICAIVVLGSAMRIFVYIRSQRILEGLAKNVIPKTRVVRDGRAMMISSEKLVPGDILLLSAGDTVPCDARIVSAAGLTVSEDRITGNTGAVVKTSAQLPAGRMIPVEERSNVLFAATTVLSGDARAAAFATGRSTYVSARHGGLVIRAGEDIPFVSALNSWCGKGSLVFLAAAVVIAFASLVLSDGTYSAAAVFLSAIAFAVASVSECFGAVVSAILASSMSEAAPEAVIKDGAMVETVSDTDCVMLSSSSVLRCGELAVIGYETDGTVTDGGTPCGELDDMLDLLCLSTGAAIGSAAAGIPGGNAAEIRALCEKTKSENYRPSGISVMGYMPASDAQSGGVDNTIFASGGMNTLLISGDAARVLSCCTSYLGKNGALILSGEKRAEIMKNASRFENGVSSVVAFATVGTDSRTFSRIGSVRSGMTYIGFIAVADPVTDGVPMLIRDMRENGCSFVMFTDGSQSDVRIAREAGIFTSRDRYVGARESSDLRSFRLDAGECAMVELPAGMDAETKTAVAEYLRDDGRVSAYIASDAADTAAMAASDSAMAVLKRDSLSRVPLSVLTGADVLLHPEKGSGGLYEAMRAVAFSKNVFANVRRAVSYMLTSQCAVTVLMLGAAFLKTPLPNSVFLLLFGMIVSFLAMLSISKKLPDGETLMKKRRELHFSSAKELLRPALIGLIWGVVTLISVSVGTSVSGGTVYSGATAMFVSVLVTSLVCAFENGALPKVTALSKTSLVPFAVYVALTSLLIVLARFSASFDSLIGGAPMSVAQLISAFVPAVILLVTSETLKRL